MAAWPGSDPRTAASALAIGQALRWYLDEVPAARAPPLPAEQARALRAALEGAHPWQPQMFDWLLTFGRAMYKLARLSPEVPDCNVGDALTALATLPAGPGTTPWPPRSTVDADVLTRLGLRAASEGVARTRRENREGWWAHGQRNRAFIEEAAAIPDSRDLAVVLGAGQAFDLPLLALVRSYQRLVLIDIDEQALAATVAGVFKEAALRARVEPRVLDLTGINAHLVRSIEDIVAGAGDADDVQAHLEQFCRSYRLAGLPAILHPGEHADLLVSSGVVSQLSWPQRALAAELYQRRFRPLRDAAEQRWARAWSELELRIQQDHINGIAAAAAVVALTSDVASQVTAIDRTGAEGPGGEKIYTLGVASLRERIPRLSEICRHASWQWPRHRANVRGAKGSSVAVEAAALRDPVAAGGLWVADSP
jgi:voltage-gated potassium channel Kch